MFISYAQNFEDVMLWRALKHVTNGFYIDIGAQDPVVDSVSLAFYEHGWRGVHVEPTNQYFSKLRVARPDEMVLQVAIGNAADSLTFYEFENTGLSTADPVIAKKHTKAGFDPIQITVDVISLDSLFDLIGNREVHWLKIDVEGMEKTVLDSWRVSDITPWLLVIESTEPSSQKESYKEWEQIVLDKGYQFVYFDGLNRFYISPEQPSLASAFTSPPSVFDGFMLSGKASHSFYKIVETKAQVAEAKAEQAEAKAEQAVAKAHQIEANTQYTIDFVKAIYASSSWRITAPLRWLGLQVQLLRQYGFILCIKMLANKLLRIALRWARSFILLHPKICAYCVKALVSIRLYDKLQLLYKRLSGSDSLINLNSEKPPLELQHLTPRAHVIYELLKKLKTKKESS